jgi:hypothetical protein
VAISWLSKGIYALRIALLGLSLLAIAGPWTYTSDGVPPPQYCRPPLILLENDRCVKLVSGASVLAFAVTGMPSLVRQLVTGAMEPGRIREFMIGVFLLPALPLVSTLFLLRRGESRELRVAHATAWGLATWSCLLLILTTPYPDPARLWGLWLYVGLAVGAPLLELLTMAPRRAEA